ncbi:MAG: hypothetical protein LUC37_02830 [Prevotella sp.]|nr:hypothetical protein [Prevotella sp.]
MRASRGEIKIEEILQANGLVFEEEYIFPDLVGNSGRPLRFDFAVLDDDGNVEFLIEYQGIQHYQPKSIFGGLTGLRKQQYNDMLKREYCRDHGLTLVLVPYWDEAKVNYDYLMRAAGYDL